MNSLRTRLKKSLPVPIARKARRTREVLGWGPGAWWQMLRQRRILSWTPDPGHRCMEGVSVHLVSGEGQAMMGLWALATLFHTSRRRWRVRLHDDGTLSEKTVRAYEARFGEGTVVRRRAADALVGERLSDFPNSARLRSVNLLALKIFDASLLAAGNQVFLLDTDVIFFREPTRILKWVDERSRGVLYNLDMWHALGISQEESIALFGHRMPEKFNSGVCLYPPEMCRLEWTEEFLSRPEVWREPSWWVEQTTLALAAGRHGLWECLPPDYEVSTAPSRSPGCSCRHYIKAVRGAFFSEGIRSMGRELFR